MQTLCWVWSDIPQTLTTGGGGGGGFLYNILNTNRPVKKVVAGVHEHGKKWIRCLGLGQTLGAGLGGGGVGGFEH